MFAIMIVSISGITSVPELGRCAEVLAVVVAQVVVADDGGRLDPRRDEKVDEDGLELGLAGLEVVAADRHSLLARQPDDSRHEGVLGAPVDVLALEKQETTQEVNHSICKGEDSPHIKDSKR